MRRESEGIPDETFSSQTLGWASLVATAANGENLLAIDHRTKAVFNVDTNLQHSC